MTTRTTSTMRSLAIALASALLTAATVGCQTQETRPASAPVGPQNADKLLIVDCLLPGQVRKLGSSLTYLTPRRPIKTSAVDCEIRGGEYTAFDRADYRTALNVWLPQAKEGDPQAQNYVGEIYEKGLGTIPDYQAAAYWYRKSAEQGESRAQINLGFLYEKGLGVKKDLAEALNWYRKASGIQEDELEFASSVEASARELARAEVEKARSETRQLREELERTRSQLQRRKGDLNAAEREMQRLREQLESARSGAGAMSSEEVERYRRALERQQSEVAAQRRRIAQLESEVSRKQADLAGSRDAARSREEQLSGELSRRDSEIDALRDRLSASEKRVAEQAAVPGPTIEILDPPISLTRGIPSVKLRSPTRSRLVVGKVTAPAGLLSLTVNDKREKVDETGVFKADVDVKTSDTPVKMVAIDRRGQRASLEFLIIPQLRVAQRQELYTKPSVTGPTRELLGKGLNFGSYYALIISNEKYQNFPPLETPTSDGRRAERILREKYGFETVMLTNATRYEILSALNALRERLGENDNLLIYYAGHGELDRVNDRGHWLPVDAERNNTANWVSNTDITDIINAMPVKHVMVVADSCYSGSMTRSSIARMDVGMTFKARRRWLEIMSMARSRTVLTSGGLQPVLDRGEGNHSIFADAFLDALEDNVSILEGYSLYRQLSERVEQTATRYGIEQTPQYAPIKHGGHEAGEFFFVPRQYL